MDNNSFMRESYGTKKIKSSFIIVAFVLVLIFSFIFLSFLSKIPGYRHEGEGPENVSGILYVIIAVVCYIVALVYYFTKSQKKNYALVLPLILSTFAIFAFDILFAYGGANAIWFLALGIFPMLMFLLPIVTVIGIVIDKR